MEELFKDRILSIAIILFLLASLDNFFVSVVFMRRRLRAWDVLRLAWRVTGATTNASCAELIIEWFTGQAAFNIYGYWPRNHDSSRQGKFGIEFSSKHKDVLPGASMSPWSISCALPMLARRSERWRIEILMAHVADQSRWNIVRAGEMVAKGQASIARDVFATKAVRVNTCIQCGHKNIAL